MPQVCLQFMIVIFPDHTHLLFLNYLSDKLDGLQHPVKHATQSMEEYLQLADEYFAKQIQDPGKKRVGLLTYFT